MGERMEPAGELVQSASRTSSRGPESLAGTLHGLPKAPRHVRDHLPSSDRSLLLQEEFRITLIRSKLPQQDKRFDSDPMTTFLTVSRGPRARSLPVLGTSG